jgi:predicted HicB family RNase H-like nuclease
MQQGIFMRTTLDLPDDILRRAKIAAVERGSSLRQLVTDALRHEI